MKNRIFIHRLTLLIGVILLSCTGCQVEHNALFSGNLTVDGQSLVIENGKIFREFEDGYLKQRFAFGLQNTGPITTSFDVCVRGDPDACANTTQAELSARENTEVIRSLKSYLLTTYNALTEYINASPLFAYALSEVHTENSVIMRAKRTEENGVIFHGFEGRADSRGLLTFIRPTLSGTDEQRMAFSITAPSSHVRTSALSQPRTPMLKLTTQDLSLHMCTAETENTFGCNPNQLPAALPPSPLPANALNGYLNMSLDVTSGGIPSYPVPTTPEYISTSIKSLRLDASSDPLGQGQTYSLSLRSSENTVIPLRIPDSTHAPESFKNSTLRLETQYASKPLTIEDRRTDGRFELHSAKIASAVHFRTVDDYDAELLIAGKITNSLAPDNVLNMKAKVFIKGGPRGAVDYVALSGNFDLDLSLFPGGSKSRIHVPRFVLILKKAGRDVQVWTWADALQIYYNVTETTFPAQPTAYNLAFETTVAGKLKIPIPGELGASLSDIKIMAALWNMGLRIGIPYTPQLMGLTAVATAFAPPPNQTADSGTPENPVRQALAQLMYSASTAPGRPSLFIPLKSKLTRDLLEYCAADQTACQDTELISVVPKNEMVRTLNTYSDVVFAQPFDMTGAPASFNSDLNTITALTQTLPADLRTYLVSTASQPSTGAPSPHLDWKGESDFWLFPPETYSAYDLPYGGPR